MSKDKILVVTTGGTIESFYNPEEGTPEDVPLDDGADKTVIPQAMKKLGIDQHLDFYPLAMRDSKYADRSEFDTLLRFLGRHGYKRIIVVDGTDKLAEHGQYLERKMAEAGMTGKSVIFTGAMNPLRDKHKQWREWGPGDEAVLKKEAETTTPLEEELVPPHDGWRNLRLAVRDMERGRPDGVYVRMGRNLWPTSRVEKYREIDRSGPVSKVTRSGFRPLTHPDSRGPKIR